MKNNLRLVYKVIRVTIYIPLSALFLHLHKELENKINKITE